MTEEHTRQIVWRKRTKKKRIVAKIAKRNSIKSPLYFPKKILNSHPKMNEREDLSSGQALNISSPPSPILETSSLIRLPNRRRRHSLSKHQFWSLNIRTRTPPNIPCSQILAAPKRKTQMSFPKKSNPNFAKKFSKRSLKELKDLRTCF